MVGPPVAMARPVATVVEKKREGADWLLGSMEGREAGSAMVLVAA